MFLVHHSLKNIYKTLTSKILRYSLNTNQKYTQTIPNAYHSYLKTAHTSRTSIELTLELKYVKTQLL